MASDGAGASPPGRRPSTGKAPEAQPGAAAAAALQAPETGPPDSQVTATDQPDSGMPGTRPAGYPAPPAPAPEEVVDLGAGLGPPWLDEMLRTELADLVTLRRKVHRHPELARLEATTSALIMRALQADGIKGRILPGGTGVIAEIGTGRRVVGLRADIDALPLHEETGLPYASVLPDVSHACGHDMHVAVLLGAARALTRAGALPGRVRLIFQPAEEVHPGGSHDVIAAGGLDGVDQLFALHCDPRLEVGFVGLKPGPITSASDALEVRLRGPGGHTSRPHLTTDLVYAMGLVITGLPALLTRRLDPRAAAVLVWGAAQAGEAANVIPREGVLRATLRMMDRRAWEHVEALVRELVGELLAPARAEYKLLYIQGVPPVMNDVASTDLLSTAAQRALGPDAVRLAEQSTGAEDFAVLLEKVPGALARLGVWDGVTPKIDLHSPSFVLDERCLAAGIRLMTQVALLALEH